MVGAEPDGLFPVEAHSSRTEDPVAKVFTEAFVRTLKLKQDLMLLGSKYKLIVFNPGDVFDSDTMIRDGDGHSALCPGKGTRKEARTLADAASSGGEFEDQAFSVPGTVLATGGEADRGDMVSSALETVWLTVITWSWMTLMWGRVCFSLLVKGVVLV